MTEYSAVPQVRVFNMLLADVRGALQARNECRRYLNRDEIAMLEREGFSVGYAHNARAQHVMCCITKP